jgi:hypothetical protein
MGSAKGLGLGLGDGLEGAQGWFLVLELGGSANGSSVWLDEKSRPRDPMLGKDWLNEARLLSACSCSSRSSIPRSCEKSGGRVMLACFSVMLRADANGSIDCRSRRRSCQLKFMLSAKRSHQSLNRSRTVSCSVSFDRVDELLRLCCGIGPSRNCELPLFKFTLGVSLGRLTTFDFITAPIPTTPANAAAAPSRIFSLWYPNVAFHFVLRFVGPTEPRSIS